MLILVRSPAAEGHPSRWAVSGMGGSFRSVALGRSAVEGEPGRHVQVLLAPLRVHSRRRLRRPFLSSRAHEAPATTQQAGRPFGPVAQPGGRGWSRRGSPEVGELLVRLGGASVGASRCTRAWPYPRIGASDSRSCVATSRVRRSRRDASHVTRGEAFSTS